MFQYPDRHGTDGDLLDAGPVTDVARVAERAGWDGFCFTEHPAPGAAWLAAGGHQTLDPFVALGAVAAVTTRMRLLTNLSVVPYRNPLLLAKAATTLDRLSDGRFTLGAGTGYLKSEFFALGIDFDERNELFDEALDVLPMHWKGEPFSYQGKHFNARDVVGRPCPLQQPIPIWIGGNSMLSLRRVAERAQGWMPLVGPAAMASTTRTPHLDTPESLGERLKVLEDLAGDRFATIDVTVPLAGATTNGSAVEVERNHDALGRLKAVGTTWVVVVAPVGDAVQTRDFIESFAGEFIGS